MSRYHKYFLILFCVVMWIVPLRADDVKDNWHQPDKVMDLVGVKASGGIWKDLCK